jgi:hypothetical protein
VSFFVLLISAAFFMHSPFAFSSFWLNCSKRSKQVIENKVARTRNSSGKKTLDQQLDPNAATMNSTSQKLSSKAKAQTVLGEFLL